jgi:hypothetical protein
MKRMFAAFACFLATLVLGFADLRLLPAESCAAGDCCCCCDPETMDPCLCGDHSPSDTPEMAIFVGFSGLIAPPAAEPPAGEIMPLSGLLPRWRPTVPWHAPPKEARARLAVWIL